MAEKPELKESWSENLAECSNLHAAAPVAMGVQQEEKIVMANIAAARLLGVESADMLSGHSLIDFVHPDYMATVDRRLRQLIENKADMAPFEIIINRPDNGPVDIEITAVYATYLNKGAVQFVLYEISKRRKIEELLFQSKQDWENTFNTITDMITVHDKDFNIIYANRMAMEKLKIPELDGGNTHKCFKYYHGTQCQPAGCPSCNCLKTGKSANFEVFEKHLNAFIEIRSMPRFDSSGNLIGLIHIARDITERKEAEKEIKKAKDELEQRVEERTSELRNINKKLIEEITERKSAVDALQKSEGKYRSLSQEFNALLNGIPDNLILLSKDLKIKWANKAAAGIFGREVSELKDSYCYSMCCSIFSPCENCPTSRSFISGKEENAEILTPDGKVWDVRAFPICDENGEVINVIELAGDITEKVSLQAGAMRTRHLASLGELAAGVAHEINNPVNNIINYAQILIDEFEEEKRDDEIARRIIRDGDRIATIVRSLLSFARIRKEEKSYVDLHEIFSDTLSLTSAQIRKDGIHLKVNMPSKFIRIPVQSQQIQQVFLNLISNARFALNQKYHGTDENKIIEITCKEIKIDNDPYVRIEFHDHGTGIPQHMIDKVINPFFSTKPNQEGTGLGLSISHGIITEHGGKFMIHSVEGESTNIIIDLPASLDNGEK